MKRVLALLVSAFTPAAFAALEVGDPAPDFSTQASLGGKELTFRLSEALKSGPVVVYFYPAAFTQGCTVEAHNFAEAMPRYQALGASVIGISTDDIATLNKFSVSECRGKFPVASDASHAIMKSYDAVLLWKTNYANRVSYVISPEGRIAYRYSAMNPDKHVENTLAAVKALVERKP